MYRASIYGIDTVRLMKKYQYNNGKIAKATARRIFLVDCRKENLIPAHIQHSHKCLNTSFKRNNPTTKKAAKIQANFRARILSLEIESTFSLLHHLEKENHAISTKIQQILPSLISSNFLETQKITYKKDFNKATEKYKIKFEKLTSKIGNIKDRYNNDTHCIISYKKRN